MVYCKVAFPFLEEKTCYWSKWWCWWWGRWCFVVVVDDNVEII